MACLVIATWRAKEGEEGRIADVLRVITPLNRAEKDMIFFQAYASPPDRALRP
jgi:hypothetical protein